MISEKQRSRLLSAGVNHHSTVIMVGIHCSEVDCQCSTTKSSKAEKFLCLQLHSQAVHLADDGRSWQPPYETVVGYGDGMFNLEHIEGNKKKRRKKKGKNKQFGTDETLDMIWGRIIREARMAPTLNSGVEQL